jgi:hypothetical protein
MRGMKCDNCGKDFAGEPVFETHEVTEGLWGRVRSYIWNSTTEPIVLCPECADRRHRLPGFILMVICAMVVGVAIISAFIKR